MAKPTEKNHTGVESYDHSSVKSLPEYHQTRQALDALVKAINAAGAEVGQAEWLIVTEQMAASLSYSDSSGHSHNGCPGEMEGAWPYRVELSTDGETVQGWYRCTHCGQEWTCSYHVNISDWV
jgi:hypothetical protein